jgi:hypothetical protein
MIAGFLTPYLLFAFVGTSKSTGRNPHVDRCRDDRNWVRIIGFGSLLSEKSARRTFPTLRDFTLTAIPGACRVFGHAAPIFFERGIANAGPPYEFSSLCAEPWIPAQERGSLNLGSEGDFALSLEQAKAAIREGRYIAATAFLIPPEAMVEFERREPEFAYVKVQPYALAGDGPCGIPAIMCGRGSDNLLRSRLEGSDSASWHSMVTQYGIDTLWHHPPDKILPCRSYLRLCVLAADLLGVKDNFLDTTLLADRQTTVREHLLRHPSLLETVPPEAVAVYYTP